MSVVVMDEIPDRSNMILHALENDNVFLTNRDTRCLKVLLNRSM